MEEYDLRNKNLSSALSKIKREDHRNGFHNLKNIIFFLRYDLGKEDNDLIPFDDIEYAIGKTCGIDQRTINKYVSLLVKFHYLEPKGYRINKTSSVTVRTFASIDGTPRPHRKEYQTPRGNSEYVFGLFAPRRMSDSSLELCVCEREIEHSSEREFEGKAFPSTTNNGETIEKKKEEEEHCDTHTYRLSESIPKEEELAVLSAIPCEEPDRSSLKVECPRCHIKQEGRNIFCSFCGFRKIESYG